MKTAGIEVSCQTLTLVINQNDRLGEPRTLGNTPDRYPELIQVLRKARVSRVCFKAMGLYHLDPALVLDGAGLEVIVIDPKAAKGFAETMQTRTETAVVDATVLGRAYFCAYRSSPGHVPTRRRWPSAPAHTGLPP